MIRGRIKEGDQRGFRRSVLIKEASLAIRFVWPCLITTVSPVFTFDSISVFLDEGTMYRCACTCMEFWDISWRMDHRSQGSTCLWCRQLDWMWQWISSHTSQWAGEIAWQPAINREVSLGWMGEHLSVRQLEESRYLKWPEGPGHHWWGNKVWGSVEKPICICLHFFAWCNSKQEDPRASCSTTCLGHFRKVSLLHRFMISH